MNSLLKLTASILIFAICVATNISGVKADDDVQVKASVGREINITFEGSSGPRTDNTVVLTNETAGSQFGSFGTNSEGEFFINLVVVYSGTQILCLQAFDVDDNESNKECFEIKIENDTYVFTGIVLTVVKDSSKPVDTDDKKPDSDVSDPDVSDPGEAPVVPPLVPGPAEPEPGDIDEPSPGIIRLPIIDIIHWPNIVTDPFMPENDLIWISMMLVLLVALAVILWKTKRQVKREASLKE